MRSKSATLRRGQTGAVVVVGVIVVVAIALALWALRRGGQSSFHSGITLQTGGYSANQMLLPGVEYVVSSPTLIDVTQGTTFVYSVILGPSELQYPRYDLDTDKALRARATPVTIPGSSGPEMGWSPEWGTAVLRGRFPRPPTKRTSGGGNGMVTSGDPVDSAAALRTLDPSTVAVFVDGNESTIFFWNLSDTTAKYKFGIINVIPGGPAEVELKHGEYVRVYDEEVLDQANGQMKPTGRHIVGPVTKMSDAQNDPNGTALVIAEFQKWCMAAGWPKPPGP